MPKVSDPGPADLEGAIDALYQAPLERFTADRNALAATLKKAGAKAEAERVKSLAKPSTTAWAVNQVWWRHRDRFQAMLDAGAAQRKAHVAWAQGRTADVREAGEARRRAVGVVTEAALDVLGGHDALGPDVQYRIAGTVEALASSGVPAGETPGRLTRDLQSSGLDALTALAEASGAIPRPTIVARGSPGSAKAPRGQAPEQAAPAPVAAALVKKRTGDTREVTRERKARDAAEAAARARAAQIAEAQARAQTLETALEAATGSAAEAASAEALARAAVADATSKREALEAALDEARGAEAAARRDLSSATAAASRAELDRARAARDVARARDALERLERGV